MSKRPFNKIRKIEKKDEDEDRGALKIDQPNPNENNRPKLSADKKKIRIANGETPKTTEQNPDPEPKFTLGSKPNLFKGRTNKPIINLNRNSNELPEEPPNSYAEAPKPTPLIIKKRLNQNKPAAEEIVIQEEQPNSRFDQEDGHNANVEESTTFKGRPDLKIKRYLKNRQASERANINDDESHNFSDPPQQPREEYIPAPIQYREISVEPSAAVVSEGKLERQRVRTGELSQLLNLQMDLYEPLLNIGNVTPYEIYINKIKGGFLKNSNDQSFDEKATTAAQTAPLEYSDFTNQCPQDYSLEAAKIDQLDSTPFDHFILRIAPVVQELIKPTDLVTEPPIFLLAFRPAFKAFLKCPRPLFLYRSEEYRLDLLVVGEKLFITEGEVTAVTTVGRTIVGGLKSGQIVVWNGENNRASRLYQTIREFTQSTNFQLPALNTHHLDRFSSFASHLSIVALLSLQKGLFASLDVTGKLVRWALEEEGVRGVAVAQLRSLTQHWALEAYGLKQRGDSFYINTSMGILCFHQQEVRQRLDTGGLRVTAFEVPKKSPLVIAATEGNTLLVFNELYSHRLFEMVLPSGDPLVDIIIPEIEHDNRELLYLFVLYLVEANGRTWEVRLLENRVEAVLGAGAEEEERGVIFRGVSRVGQSLQTVRLMRDLKVNSSVTRMAVNTEKSIPNLKAILEKNRELMTMLQQENVMII